MIIVLHHTLYIQYQFMFYFYAIDIYYFALPIMVKACYSQGCCLLWSSAHVKMQLFISTHIKSGCSNSCQGYSTYCNQVLESEQYQFGGGDMTVYQQFGKCELLYDFYEAILVSKCHQKSWPDRHLRCRENINIQKVTQFYIHCCHQHRSDKSLSSGIRQQCEKLKKVRANFYEPDKTV